MDCSYQQDRMSDSEPARELDASRRALQYFARN